MPVPEGAKTARWNQAVNAVVSALGWTQNQADTWLTSVWNGMFDGNEVAGQVAAHVRLKTFLEANSPGAPTLPVAFTDWVRS